LISTDALESDRVERSPRPAANRPATCAMRLAFGSRCAAHGRLRAFPAR
jgi:hypothetical protein